MGSSSIPDKGSQRRPHSGLHPSLSGWSINGYLGQPREGELWELRCHIGPMSRGKGFLSTTGSRAKETGDEHPKQRAAAAYAPHFTFFIMLIKLTHIHHSYVGLAAYSRKLLTSVWQAAGLKNCCCSSVRVIPIGF